MAKGDVVIVGLGEVGRPLFQLIGAKHRVIGVDLEPVETDGACSVLHVCYPFIGRGDAFVRTTVEYIHRYGPALTVIDSTVAPGTTREVYRRAGTPIAYSPVRGKHCRMSEDMLHYTKFVGGIDSEAAIHTAVHFQSIGMKTRIVDLPETAELAKLTETTYFGVLIAWAQEVERYCERLRVDYDQVVSFYSEVPFLPSVKYFPGAIGGHCVLPNIAILKSVFDSDFLDAIVASDDLKRRTEMLKTGAIFDEYLVHRS